MEISETVEKFLSTTYVSVVMPVIASKAIPKIMLILSFIVFIV